ncbi:MAG: MipA/OmpV family protein [Pseudomonadota bacterium]
MAILLRIAGSTLGIASMFLAPVAVSAQSGPPETGQEGEGSEERRGPPPGIPADSVFDETWATVGIGVAASASYRGSDDYRVIPLPVVQGQIEGVRIQTRGPGATLNFIPEKRDELSFSAGPAFRFRNDRASQIEDEVVELAGELDTALEVGLAAGVSVPGVLIPVDRLSFDVEARWDVLGAHDGRVIEPRISLFSPLSRGAAASIGLSAEFVDDNYADYYFSVSPAQSLASGLPEFEADGGLQSLGANVFLAVDLDGNAFNGGFSVVTIGGYTRLVGDAADTPYTSERGSADQFFGAIGIGYTF